MKSSHLKQNMRDKNIYGFLLLETLISVAILALLTVAIFPNVSFLLLRATRAKYDAQATLLLQEGMEAAYNVLSTRQDWDAYLTNQNYKPVHNGTWMLTNGIDANLETRFRRRIVFSSVCRNPQNGEQNTQNCQIDPNSKIVTTEVEWTESDQPKQISAQLLLIKELQRSN